MEKDLQLSAPSTRLFSRDFYFVNFILQLSIIFDINNRVAYTPLPQRHSNRAAPGGDKEMALAQGIAIQREEHVHGKHADEHDRMGPDPPGLS